MILSNATVPDLHWVGENQITQNNKKPTSCTQFSVEILFLCQEKEAVELTYRVYRVFCSLVIMGGN